MLGAGGTEAPDPGLQGGRHGGVCMDGLQPLLAENTLPKDRPLGVPGRATTHTRRDPRATSAGVSVGKTPEHLLLPPWRALGFMPGAAFLGTAVAPASPRIQNVPSLWLPLGLLRKSETRHEALVPVGHLAAGAPGPTPPVRSRDRASSSARVSSRRSVRPLP